MAVDNESSIVEFGVEWVRRRRPVHRQTYGHEWLRLILQINFILDENGKVPGCLRDSRDDRRFTTLVSRPACELGRGEPVDGHKTKLGGCWWVSHNTSSPSTKLSRFLFNLGIIEWICCDWPSVRIFWLGRTIIGGGWWDEEVGNLSTKELRFSKFSWMIREEEEGLPGEVRTTEAGCCDWDGKVNMGVENKRDSVASNNFRCISTTTHSETSSSCSIWTYTRGSKAIKKVNYDCLHFAKQILKPCFWWDEH